MHQKLNNVTYLPLFCLETKYDHEMQKLSWITYNKDIHMYFYQEAKNIATRYVSPSLGLGIEGDIEDVSSFFAPDPEGTIYLSQVCGIPSKRRHCKISLSIKHITLCSKHLMKSLAI